MANKSPLGVFARPDNETSISARLIRRALPAVRLAFCTTQLSEHQGHIPMHHTETPQFERYQHQTSTEIRLHHWALIPRIVGGFELGINAIGVKADVIGDGCYPWVPQMQCLRLHSSQENPEAITSPFETETDNSEQFHQPHPPIAEGIDLGNLFNS